ncbi:protein of unassigned function [Methylobacterium oryzae CBMB20]|uniref:Protein of unassigned function n=1 Tax=Methylobacterium oryzae CBMB20 TaxID=693986 RepID=A0A089NS01_9HYPH|nr:protein of unassigned function [Methylobacterium oryzae CBMB20]
MAGRRSFLGRLRIDRSGWFSAGPVSGTDREKRTLGRSKFMPKAKWHISIQVII